GFLSVHIFLISAKAITVYIKLNILLLGKIGQMMTKEVCPKSESGKLRGIFDLGMAAYRLRSRLF
ncbi:hypothetical protein P3690_26555, partial [Vibrio parahaemolyticus]|nr:hypothetical protein [Vibrio parahaemolyticus]